MRLRSLSLALIGGLGVVAGWWAHSALSQPGQAPARAAEPGAPAQNSVIASAPVQPARQQSALRGTSGAEDNSRVTAEVGDSPDAGPVELVANQPSDDAPLTGLLTSEKIECRFDPGNAARMNGPNNMSMYELADRPITYDSIDITAEKARMTGGIGATGSRDGVLDVHMIATHAGLHFSAVNSRGELLVTTVFGALEEGGRHRAVMAVHGSQAEDGSFQVYGSCDSFFPAMH
jgi:hypothetical protein